MWSLFISFSKSNIQQIEECRVRPHTQVIEMQSRAPTSHCKAKTMFPSKIQHKGVRSPARGKNN